jgi:hypothetical protein
MKFSIYALLIAGLFSFSSCDKDDDGVKLSSEAIVGTWNLTTYDSDADVGIGFAGVFETTNAVSTMSNSTVTITFDASGNWTSTGDYTLTTTSDGETETEDVTGGIGSGTYTVVDGRLTMNDIDAGDESDVESIEFDTNYSPDTKIDLEANVKESGSDPVFGLDFEIDLMLNMTLEK